MASIYDANTNYTVNGTDLRYNPGMVTREYLIDVYPSLIDNFRFAGLWTWGDNSFGQLGINNILNYSSPVQTISGGTNWKQVSGGSSTTAAIKTDGTLWLWGLNSNGQLGDNTITHRSSPVQTISGGTDWKQVSCGGTFTAAIKTTGTLWLWGENLYGQLGTNDRIYKSSPVQTVSGGTNWKQVSCGGSHAAAIKNDGTLWLWGKNTPSGFSGGQLGDNTLLHRSSPVQTIAGGTNWKQVSCGSEHTAAIKTDGTLWLWGSNATGGLGNDLNSDRSSPIQTVTGGTNWKQIECGQENTAAIKTDGTLWLWGFNQNGALGDNTRTHRSSPVQTVSGGTNWKQVSLGSFFTGAIKNDGTLWTWGVNTSGQLGDNTVVSKSSPIQTISTGTNWKQVICASSITICIRDDSSDPFRAEPI
jgi:hypothetical protein